VQHLVGAADDIGRDALALLDAGDLERHLAAPPASTTLNWWYSPWRRPTPSSLSGCACTAKGWAYVSRC